MYEIYLTTKSTGRAVCLGGGNFRLYYTIEGDINIYPI